MTNNFIWGLMTMTNFDGLNMKFIEKTKIGTIYEYPYNNKSELKEILKVARSTARKNNLPDIIGVNICEGYVQWCQPERNASDPIFKAKIDDSIIYVYAVGKWRPIRHYAPKNKIPSAKIQEQVIKSIWYNTGKRFDLTSAKLQFIND